MPSRILACDLLAEAVERGHLPGLAGGFEFLDRIDAQLFVERLDLLGAEPGDVQHLDQARAGRTPSVLRSRGAARW